MLPVVVLPNGPGVPPEVLANPDWPKAGVLVEAPLDPQGDDDAPRPVDFPNEGVADVAGVALFIPKLDVPKLGVPKTGFEAAVALLLPKLVEPNVVPPVP